MGALVAGALAAASSGDAQTPNPVLDIAEWSYHWYGVEHALLARGTVCNGMQMYVERWIPRDVRHPYPVVLIHGGFGQGSDWFSTIDGRRGWASLFLEQGYKVYVLDRPGQGRNPYQPFVHGAFAAQAPTFEANGGNPQAVASMNQPMANNAQTQSVWRSRGAMLLDDIGPSILVTDGDGAVFARVTAEERPALIKGVVAVAPPAGTAFKVFTTTASSREPESLPAVLA